MLQFMGTSDKSAFVMFVEFISVQKPKPRVRHRVIFPTDGETDAAILPTLQQFCFPFESAKDKYNQCQYIFHLAARDGGSPTYGYVLKPGHKGGSAFTYCLISQYFAPAEMFMLMTDYMEAVDRQALYSDFFYDRLTVHVPPEKVVENRDAVIEYHITEVMKSVGAFTLAAMIHAVVTDKRLVMIAKSLQQLTQCEFALLCLIHPLSIGMFTPVLPMSMLDALGSPFPYVIGIHSSLKKTYAAMETEPHVLVNLSSRAPKYERLAQPPEQIRNLFKTFEANVKKVRRDAKEVKRLVMNLVLEIIGLGLACDPHNPSEIVSHFERRKYEADEHDMAENPMLNDVLGSMVAMNLLEGIKPGNEMLKAYWPGKTFTRPRTRTVRPRSRPLIPEMQGTQEAKTVRPKIIVDPNASQIDEIMRLATLFGQRQISIDEEVQRSKQMMRKQQVENPEKLSFRSKLRIYDQGA